MEEGGYNKEEGEDGKYGKNSKEVRLGMATREAGRVRNEGLIWKCCQHVGDMSS